VFSISVKNPDWFFIQNQCLKTG